MRRDSHHVRSLRQQRTFIHRPATNASGSQFTAHQRLDDTASDLSDPDLSDPDLSDADFSDPDFSDQSNPAGRAVITTKTAYW